jgi:hypothetical protein
MALLRNTCGTVWIALILLTMAGTAQIASGASLNIGNAQASPGDAEVKVNADLEVTGGEDVAALQLDLQFDGRLKLVDVYSASASTDADKSAVWYSQGNGTARILLYGLNQNTIGDGPVFQMIFTVENDALPGQSNISVKNPAAADPAGGGVSISTQSGYVSVGGGAGSSPAVEGDDGGGGGGGCFLSVL